MSIMEPYDLDKLMDELKNLAESQKHNKYHEMLRQIDFLLIIRPEEPHE